MEHVRGLKSKQLRVGEPRDPMSPRIELLRGDVAHDGWMEVGSRILRSPVQRVDN